MHGSACDEMIYLLQANFSGDLVLMLTKRMFCHSFSLNMIPEYVNRRLVDPITSSTFISLRPQF